MKVTTDTPIQTDVVDADTQAAASAAPEKTSRDSIMDSIVANRSEELSGDLKEYTAQEDALVDPDLSVDSVAAAPKGKEEKTVPITIDGVTTEVTPEEIREYQINKAADLRMREVDAEAKRLADREADIARREAELEAATVVAHTPVQADPEEAKALAKKLVQSTFDEDEDSAAEVIQEIMASRQQGITPAPVAQTLSPEDINAGIEEVLFRREQKKAIERFGTEYPFLASNMRDAVNERSKVEAANDPQATTWELIDRSAKYIQSEIEKEFDVKRSVVDDLAVRREQKAAAGSTVKTGANVKAALPDKSAAPPQTRNQSFAEIQRARGQG